MTRRLIFPLVAVLLSLWLTATARSTAWLTYQDAAAGFAFDYPADAQLSVAQEASQGYASAFVTLPAGVQYQGYAVAVFANPADLTLARFLSEVRGFTSFGGQDLRLNGVTALRAAPGTTLAGDDAEVYWLRGDHVVMRLGLYAGRDKTSRTSAAARAAFDQAIASFRLIPRSSPAAQLPPSAPTPEPDRPDLTDAFISPYGAISTTTQYAEQWNIITSDTRYGVRNFSLPGTPRKCWNVTWPRMLHSGLDLYRLDGQDAANTDLVAVADGTVAYYDPNYSAYPGSVVILSHPLNDGRVIYSMYAHLRFVYVKQGQIVARGQPIGTVLPQPGDSHLHFEMRWFFDGSHIYPSSTACNGIVFGRGYTYLTHPDDFPAPDHGYINPDAFIQAHGGPPLTPIGLPDPRGPVLGVQAHSEDVSITTAITTSDHNPRAAKPAPFDLGGPEIGNVSATSMSDTIKLPPALTETLAITSPVQFDVSPDAAPAPSVVNTDTLTYTVYLPVLAHTLPKQEPSCVEGQELLSNGGFEGGSGSAPWVQLTNGSSDLISQTLPYTGTYSLWLGGRDTADEEALQSFVVPYYTEALTLTFKRLLTTQETDPLVYDHFELVLENQVGNEVTSQVALNNLSPNRNLWAAETAVFAGFQNWANRRLRLSIKGMTDGNLPTSLFLDEVSLQTRCAP